MKKPNEGGFGIITAIVVLAAIILAGAGGTYLLIEHEKKAVSNLFEESSVEIEKDTDGSEEETVVEEESEKDKDDNPSKLEKEPVTVAATIHPKGKAEVYIYKDPSGIPNRFNITCKVGTERQVSMFYIYPGDGSKYNDSPIAGRDQISQTHTYQTSSAISYNVKCVPVYDSTDSPFTHLSPYVGTAMVTLQVKTSSPVQDEPSDAYKDTLAKIKPIDSDPEVISAVASYEGIIAASSDAEAKPHITSDEYEIWGGRADSDGNYEGWSDEGWSLRGYLKDYLLNGEKVVVLWFDIEGTPQPVSLGFIKEDGRWKLSPGGTIAYSLLLWQGALGN